MLDVGGGGIGQGPLNTGIALSALMMIKTWLMLNLVPEVSRHSQN